MEASSLAISALGSDLLASSESERLMAVTTTCASQKLGPLSQSAVLKESAVAIAAPLLSSQASERVWTVSEAP